MATADTVAQSITWTDGDWPALSFGEALARAISEYGAEHVAFDFEAEKLRMSLGDLDAAVYRFARALRANGFEPGDSIAVWAPGRSLWPVAELAAPIVGGRVCGINTRYRRDEIVHVLRTLAPKFAFVVPDFLEIDSLSLVGEGLARAELTGRSEVVVCPLDRSSTQSVGGCRTLASFLRVADDAPKQSLPETAPADRCIVQFTSGSTGHPKGVEVTQDNALRAAFNIAMTQGFTPADTLYSAMPFYHIAGTICTGLIPIVNGATVVIGETFDAARALDSIASKRCTAFHGNGPMYTMLLDEFRRKPRDVTALRKGWAVASPALMDRIRDELGMKDVVITYGASENGVVAGTTPNDPWEKRRDTIGRPMPGVSVSLRDPTTGAKVAPGQPGEFWVKGPMVMIGYLNDPDATRAVFDDGWQATGDLGRLDEDGYYRFVGRIKEILRPGGENVSAAEVERFLMEDPRIGAVCVVGMPDRRLGEVPVAAIQSASGAEVSVEETIARCKDGIANFKVPRQIKVVDKLPLLGTGRVDRLAVEQLFAESQE